MSFRFFARRLARCLVVAAAVVVSVLAAGHHRLEAKAPGITHCYKGVCHRVRTLDETRMLLGSTLVMAASHYDFPWNDRFNIGVFTSNGERFDAGDRDRVSSSDFPDGTELLLRNPQNGRVSHVRVNDFGPFHGDRRLDVTRRVADDLGFAKRGVTDLEVSVIAIPREDDLTYRRNRPRTQAMGSLGSYGEADMAALITQKLSARSPADASRILITTPLNLRHPTEGASRNPPFPVAEASALPDVAAEAESNALPAKVIIDAAHLSTSAELPAPRPGTQVGAAVSEDTPQIPIAHHLTSGTQQVTASAEPDTFTAMAEDTAPAVSTLEPAADAPAFSGQSIAASGLHHALAFADAPAFASSAVDSFSRTAFVPPPMSTRALLLVLMMLLTMGIIAASWNVGPAHASAERRHYATSPRDHRIGVSPAPIARVAASTTDNVQISARTTDAPAAVAHHQAEVTIATPQASAVPLETGTSLISPEMSFDGILRTTGRIAIAGHVEGRIEAQGIEIRAGGRARGWFVADEITIDGYVEGSITARLVRIGPNARIAADITCELIAMDERANVDASFRRPPANA